MIINRPGASFVYKGVKYVVGEEIIGTDQSEYRNLIGYITEIRDGEDKETENDTPDIYCSFEPPVSPYDIAELEKTFSGLYDEPKKLEDIILDMVIMAPEMIIPTRELNSREHTVTVYIVQQDWAVDGEEDTTNDVFLDYRAAKQKFHCLLQEEAEQGCISDWCGRDCFICDSDRDHYEAYLEGEYMLNHYVLTITSQVLPLPTPIFKRIGSAYIEIRQKKDFAEQIAGWDGLSSLSDEQYEQLIADESIPELLQQKLGQNDAYWEAYWESVSEVAHELVQKYLKENQT